MNGLKARTARKFIRRRSLKACWRGACCHPQNPAIVVTAPSSGPGPRGGVEKGLGRRYIGFERDQAYATAAEARIAAIEPLPEATLAPFMTARDAPRVAVSG